MNRPVSTLSLPSVKLVRALYDYRGENNDELCIAKGDLITVTQTPDGGWFEGTLDGVTGWFPSNYAEPVDPSLLSPDNELMARSLSPFIEDTDNEHNRKLVMLDVIDSEAAFVTELIELEGRMHSMLPRLIPPSAPVDVNQVLASLNNLLKCHRNLLVSLQQLDGRNPRVGGTFLQLIPSVTLCHVSYCKLHPGLVSVLQTSASLWSPVKTSDGPMSMGFMTTGLSTPFRRLDRYPGLLQELARYTMEGDPDRGDTQRSLMLMRDLMSKCHQVRRMKDMEVEVMRGGVKEWPSPPFPAIESLGQIQRMDPVTVTMEMVHVKKLPSSRPESSSPTDMMAEGKVLTDRFAVLFKDRIVLLRTGHDLTCFTFEDDVPLNRITTYEQVDHIITVVSKVKEPSTHRTRYTITFNQEDEEDAASDWMHLLGLYVKPMPEVTMSPTHSVASPVTTLNNLVTQQMVRSPSHLGSFGSSSTTSSTSMSVGSNPHVGCNFTTGYAAKTGFWSQSSMLPHSSVHFPDIDPKAFGSTHASRVAGKRSLSPGGDLSILQLIESYCTVRGSHGPVAHTGHGVVSSTWGEKGTTLDTIYDEVNSDLNLQHVVKSLVHQVNEMKKEMELMKEQMKQMRTELDGKKKK